MPELEAFEAEVKNRIKQLASKNARTRRRAAAWLGESGDPTAITALAKAYRDDADPQVREAARYALGMFRALEQAWEEDQDRTMDILREVTLNGKMGRRVPVPVRRLVKFELALLLSAVLVAALAFVLPSLLRGGQAPPAPAPVAQPPGDRSAQLAGLRQAAQQLSADVETLRQQYQGVLAGAAVNCAATFVNPTIAAAADADLAAIAADLERAAGAFREAQTRYTQACSGGAALAPGEIGALLGTLAGVSQTLATVDQSLTAAGSPPPDAPPAPAVATPTAETPAQPSESPAAGAPDLRIYVSDLQRIVDTMTDLRGPVTALRQYWQEAVGAGATAGCSEPRPALPQEYELPPEIAAASQELMLATDLVSTGLQLTQQNWDEFAAACAGGTLAAAAAEGQRKADAAATAFDSAAKLLAELRGSQPGA